MDGGFPGQPNMQGPTQYGDTLLEIFMRMGAVQQALAACPTHEKLNNTTNELRRDFNSRADSIEKLFRELMSANKEDTNEKVGQMQLALHREFTTIAEAAATKALERQREADKRAEEAIDNKTKNAVRGLKTLMMAVGPITGGALVFAALVVAKVVFGWSL